MSNHPEPQAASVFVTEQTVRKLLAKLSGLPFAKPVDADTVADWFAVLRREGVTQSELAEAYLRIIGTAKEWVPLATIIEECREVRRERTPYAPPLPPPTGTPITPEERDEILKGLKNPAFALEVIEGRGERQRYRIEREDDVIISDEDLAKRDEQVRRMRGEA
jgi:hypothetical protein